MTDWKAFKFKADGLEKEDPSTGIIPMSEWDPNNWPAHIHRPKEEAEEQKPAVTVPAERYPFTPDVYAYRILPQLIREAGGSIPIKRTATAYALLADADLRSQTGIVFDQAWERSFKQPVEVGAFRVALARLAKQEYVKWSGDVLDGSLTWSTYEPEEEVETYIVEDAKLALMMAKELPEPLQQSSETIKRILEAMAA